MLKCKAIINGTLSYDMVSFILYVRNYAVFFVKTYTVYVIKIAIIVFMSSYIQRDLNFGLVSIWTQCRCVCFSIECEVEKIYNVFGGVCYYPCCCFFSKLL